MSEQRYLIDRDGDYWYEHGSTCWALSPSVAPDYMHSLTDIEEDYGPLQLGPTTPEPKGLPRITAPRPERREVVDKDGDHWVEVGADKWVVKYELDDYDLECCRSLDAIKCSWGPVEFIETTAAPEPEDEDAPHADLLEDLEALVDELQELSAHVGSLAGGAAYGAAADRLQEVITGASL